MVANGFGGRPQLLSLNENKICILQGSPIFDVLANMYLLEFDKVMKSHADLLGEIYQPTEAG